MSEWGNPAGVMPSNLLAEYIGLEEPTQGSEPSQYLEEEKATAIPLVAASESGTAQTQLSTLPIADLRLPIERPR